MLPPLGLLSLGAQTTPAVVANLENPLENPQGMPGFADSMLAHGQVRGDTPGSKSALDHNAPATAGTGSHALAEGAMQLEQPRDSQADTAHTSGNLDREAPNAEDLQRLPLPVPGNELPLLDTNPELSRRLVALGALTSGAQSSAGQAGEAAALLPPGMTLVQSDDQLQHRASTETVARADTQSPLAASLIQQGPELGGLRSDPALNPSQHQAPQAPVPAETTADLDSPAMRLLELRKQALAFANTQSQRASELAKAPSDAVATSKNQIAALLSGKLGPNPGQTVGGRADGATVQPQAQPQSMIQAQLLAAATGRNLAPDQPQLVPGSVPSTPTMLSGSLTETMNASAAPALANGMSALSDRLVETTRGLATRGLASPAQGLQKRDLANTAGLAKLDLNAQQMTGAMSNGIRAGVEGLELNQLASLRDTAATVTAADPLMLAGAKEDPASGVLPGSLLAAGGSARGVNMEATLPSGLVPTSQGARLDLGDGQGTQWVGRLSQMIAQQQVTGQSLRIALSPAELGAVELTFKGSADNWSVALSAQQGQTRELLETHLDRIRSMLQDLGHRDAQVSLESRWNGGQTGTSAGHGQDPETSAEPNQSNRQPVAMEAHAKGSDPDPTFASTDFTVDAYA